MEMGVTHSCGVLCLVAQSCPTLCDPWTVACQVPLSMGILQVRILEWVAMPPPGYLCVHLNIFLN